jgi:hypothetical protein
MLSVLTLEGQSNATKVVYSFMLKNPRLSQQAPSLTATASLFYVEGVSWNPAFTFSCDASKTPFFIDSLEWSTVSVDSSSSNPCGLNTITVNLVPSTISLACLQCITISGFENSNTNDKASSAVTAFSIAGVNRSSAISSSTWTRSSGTLNVCFSGSMGIIAVGSSVALRFDIQNRNTALAAKSSITVKVSVDNGASLSNRLIATNNFMPVEPHSWQDPPSLSMSTSQVIQEQPPLFISPLSSCRGNRNDYQNYCSHVVKTGSLCP